MQRDGSEPSEFERVHQSFLDIEQEYGLFEVTIDGVPVWERARSQLHKCALKQSGAVAGLQTGIGLSVREYLQGIGLWAKNAFVRNPFLSGQRDFLFLGHQRRKRIEDGYWWDIYCDPLYEKLDLDYVHFERPYRVDHRRPPKTERLRYLDLIEYTGTLQRKTGIVSASIPGRAAQTLTAAEREFKNRIGIELDVTGAIRRQLELRRSTKWLYERLLSRVDPKIAVVLVSYSKETFIEACKDRGVPVVELQHGIIHEYHPGYAYPGDRPKETFPDYLFLFGDFWADAVEFPIGDDRIRSVGYPYLEARREAYAETPARDEVVFVSQRSIGQSLADIAVRLNRMIDHNVVFKLHPGEYENWESRYPDLSASAVTVIDTDEPPLYELFAESTVQVGVGSTALYEGIEFGLQTFVVDLSSVEYVRPLVERGYATLVTAPDEIASGIDETAPQVDSAPLFAEDAVENIHRAFADVLTEVGNDSGEQVS